MSAIIRPDDLIPLREASGLIPSRKPGRKIHAASLSRWIKVGKLQGWRIGGVWFVSRADVLAIAVPSVALPAVASRGQRQREIEAAARRLDDAGM